VHARHRKGQSGIERERGKGVEEGVERQREGKTEKERDKETDRQRDHGIDPAGRARRLKDRAKLVGVEIPHDE